ncbi:MAG TPA: hypothetical protein VG370_24280 [Chloroflexota bacterium]|nr:hypothetical protein [Chloroflexota bacterium]
MEVWIAPALVAALAAVGWVFGYGIALAYASAGGVRPGVSPAPQTGALMTGMGLAFTCMFAYGLILQRMCVLVPVH